VLTLYSTWYTNQVNIAVKGLTCHRFLLGSSNSGWYLNFISPSKCWELATTGSFSAFFHFPLQTKLIPLSILNLPEELISAKLFKIFLTYYGTQRFLIEFTRHRHWPLFWALWIQSTAIIVFLYGMFYHNYPQILQVISCNSDFPLLRKAPD